MISPSGYSGSMFCSIHRFASVGDIFQPELQVATNSTNDSPFRCIEFSKALRNAFFALRTAPGVWTLCRVK